ncbi:MAG: ribbon-helix-helix protein, CopG family [Butyricicoccus sp.]|nr:ribbon-helix-helix protein, CopG family [Butyricicoccus sp.]MBQ8586261.1 ribbon-helix-helix protein, CopG family [Butyricicoccus sp.]
MEKFSPKKYEKEVISLRISSDVLNEIDQRAAETDISRNEFINQCIDFALKNIVVDEEV